MTESQDARPYGWWIAHADDDRRRFVGEIEGRDWVVFAGADESRDPPVALCLGRSADGRLVCTGLIVGLAPAHHGVDSPLPLAEVEVTSRALRDIPIANLVGRALPLLTEQEQAPEWLVNTVSGRLAELPPVKRNPGPRGHSEEHFQAVAQWYRRALDEHPRAPIEWLAERLYADRSTVNRWVRRARDKGYLGEAMPGRAGERPGGRDE